MAMTVLTLLQAMLLTLQMQSVSGMGGKFATSTHQLNIEPVKHNASLATTAVNTTALRHLVNTWLRVESYNPAYRLRGTVMALEQRAEPQQDAGVVLASAVASVFVWSVFFLAAAFLYKKTMGMSELDIEKYSESNSFKGEDFKHSVFLCHEAPKLCLCGFFCSGLPWADTMGVLGLIGFWMGLLLWVCAVFLDSLTGGISWLFMAAVFTYFRQQIRKKFEMKNETTDMVTDYALWVFCPCCSIVQEARQAQEVPTKIVEVTGERETEPAASA